MADFLAPDERRQIVELYEGRLDDLGQDVRTLGWKDRDEQECRFAVLADIGDLGSASVCDVGCGFGDLLTYLEGSVTPDRYTGIDIVPSFVEIARQRHPGATFRCADLTTDVYEEEADYFVLSGALSYRVADNMALATAMLAKMFRLARRGVAVNFLTSYCTYQHIHNFHYQPEEMFRVGRGLTQWVKLRHDYPLWEFTLYLYKEPVSG